MLTLTTVQPSPPPPTGQRDAARQAAGLLLVTILLCVVLIAAAAAVLASRRWSRRAGRPNTPTRRTDAWAAAADRTGMIEPDPDLPDDNDRFVRED